MKEESIPEQYPAVGIYHRVVVPTALVLIGLVLLIGSIENLSHPNVGRQGTWITLTVIGSVLVAGSVWLFVFSTVRHRRNTSDVLRTSNDSTREEHDE